MEQERTMGAVFVLLNDNNDGTALIACPDLVTAKRVGSAAVFSDGGVSAWLVPTRAIEASEDVLEVLRGGGSISDLSEVEERQGYVVVRMDMEAE